MDTLAENKFHKVALALGSNVGDAEVIFLEACKLLEQKDFKVTAMASVIRTEPVDCPIGTPDFSNSALIGTFGGTAEELLSITQGIEQALGRPADHGFHTPRTLDIDIILFGDVILLSKKLTIPHPAAKKRGFVLTPLSEIAPDWVFPDSGISVSSALKILSNTMQENKCNF